MDSSGLSGNVITRSQSPVSLVFGRLGRLGVTSSEQFHHARQYHTNRNRGHDSSGKRLFSILPACMYYYVMLISARYLLVGVASWGSPDKRQRKNTRQWLYLGIQSHYASAFKLWLTNYILFLFAQAKIMKELAEIEDLLVLKFRSLRLLCQNRQSKV